jgi:hypothetical protein
MALSNRLALVFSLLAVLAAYLVSVRVFENLPHLEDEMAFVWQAQAAVRGYLTLPSPPEPESFLVPFVVDYQGQRFGKYPLGWPALLTIGEVFHLRSWVNPLLAGFSLWLIYLLGKRTFGPVVGLLAAGLTLTSPFFLMLMGSLLSHPLGLTLSAAFCLSWLDAFVWRRAQAPWLPVAAGGAALGALALTRPLTAVGIALPFAAHGLLLLLRGSPSVRRRVLVVGGVAAALASLHFVWQYAVTGDPFLNPYTLWWEYDRVGFGPGVGRVPSGHSLAIALGNTGENLWVGIHDLFGWGPFSWIFIPFGLSAVFYRRWRTHHISLPGLLLVGTAFSLLLVYMAYWVGSTVLGPRYYFEALHSLTILSGAGIAFLTGWPIRPDEPWNAASGRRKLRPLGTAAVLALLLSVNLVFYLPARMATVKGLYSIQRAHLEPFSNEEAQALTPAVVIVSMRHSWTEYGTLLSLNNPFLDTPFLVVLSQDPSADQRLARHFPERRVFTYHPHEPGVFHELPRAP